MRTDTFGWLESISGDRLITAAEIKARGLRVVSREDALLPLPEDVDAAADWLHRHDPKFWSGCQLLKDAAADWLHRHDPDEGGAPVPVR